VDDAAPGANLVVGHLHEGRTRQRRRSFMLHSVFAGRCRFGQGSTHAVATTSEDASLGRCNHASQQQVVPRIHMALNDLLAHPVVRGADASVRHVEAGGAIAVIGSHEVLKPTMLESFAEGFDHYLLA